MKSTWINFKFSEKWIIDADIIEEAIVTGGRGASNEKAYLLFLPQ